MNEMQSEPYSRPRFYSHLNLTVFGVSPDGSIDSSWLESDIFLILKKICMHG